MESTLAYGARALQSETARKAVRFVPLPLVARSVRDLLMRRVRRGAVAGPTAVRSPDLFGDVAAWSKRNPELVATVALGVGALLGGKYRLLKAGLTLLPNVVPRLLPNVS